MMSKLINLTGQRFGFWLVKEKCLCNKDNHSQWLCMCECGIEKCITSNSLRTGNSTSCGCNKTPNLTGRIFDKLTVIGLNVDKDKSRRHWNCNCKCGNSIVVSTYELRQEIVWSCGCDIAKSNKSKDINTKLKDNINELLIKLFPNNNVFANK